MYVVTLPKKAQYDPEAFAQRAKGAGVDALEIRGDLTPDVPSFDSRLPLIIAPRGSNILLQRFKPEYVDIDLNEKLPVAKSAEIIRSYHDFEKTGSVSELLQIAEQLMEGSDVIKIATTIISYADLRALEELHTALPRDQKRIILGMGDKAHLSRLLSPLRNAFTYTYLDEGEQSAPGQVPLSLHRLTTLCTSPKIFGLLCSPGLQSLSPLIHNTLFARNNVDALYTLFLTDDLDDAYDNLISQGVAGFSVTSPFKQAIISKLDRVDENAEKIGTVNTVVREGTKYFGYTRDTHGLVEGYPFLKEAQSIAILGSGGVVPSVIEACRLSGAKDIRIFARNQEAAEALASKFSVQHEDLSSLSSFNADIIISAISEDVSLTLPKAKVGALAIDLRYKETTAFQTEAKGMDYTVHDGLPMLMHQAIAQFRLFTGSEPSSQSVQEVFSLLHHGKQ